MRKLLLTFIVFILFFLASLLSLNDYGISWDEPTHFKRGQGYLWYIVSGDNDYHKLPKYDLRRAQTDPLYHERSIYQDDLHNAAFYRTIDGTHPPLADILASATNMIFYQKLGLLGDVESYHLFEIFVSSLGVAFLFLFVFESFGLVSALFSTILFAAYPLFWAESHFNIKDPIETSWIILTIYFLWKGVKEYSVRYIFVSSIFAGFALGTKFNVIFLPFIVLTWLVFIFTTQKKQLLSFLKKKSVIAAVLLYPVIVLGIFYLSYPFLWDNPVENIGKVLSYYQNNALNPAFANAVLPEWPLYALRWVLFTAPPLALAGFLLSIIFSRDLLFKHNSLIILVFLWLSVTILRVSIPGINIYGGVRQIMEYIPALSILAGVGLAQVLGKARREIIILALLAASVVSIFPLVRLHPNENVYFNFLAGGLKVAVESGIPAAGNSFGNTYYQGVMWINQNALKDSKITLLQGSAVNIPRYKLRSDLNLSGDYFSGINREGEYLMELTFNWEHKENFYAWEYAEKFLEPVYEVKADGVVILKIWKNDLEHTKTEYKLEERELAGNIIKSQGKSGIDFMLPKEFLISRLIVSYDLVEGCSKPFASTVHTSIDGEKWTREGDPLNFSQVGKESGSFKPAWESFSTETEFIYNDRDSDNNKTKETSTYYFSGENAKFIRLALDNNMSCIFNNPKIKIIYLDGG